MPVEHLEDTGVEALFMTLRMLTYKKLVSINAKSTIQRPILLLLPGGIVWKYAVIAEISTQTTI